MTDKIVDEYQRRLRAHLRGLPGEARRELLAQIEEHITQRLAEPGGREPEAVREMLRRLGEPAVLAREARERLGVPELRRGGRETAVLLLGALAPLAVLLPAAALGRVSTVGSLVLPVLAVVLLWLSPLWPPRDKLLGTGLLLVGSLVLPAARALPGVASVEESGGLPFLAVALLAVAGPFLAATLYLAVRSRRPVLAPAV